MSRTFDFHDMGLFLEIECPVSSQPTVVQCSRPVRPHVTPVVGVDKIQPGELLEIDMYLQYAGARESIIGGSAAGRITEPRETWNMKSWQRIGRGSKIADISMCSQLMPSPGTHPPKKRCSD